MQSFLLEKEYYFRESKQCFFRKGQTFEVKVYKDPRDPTAYGPGFLDELNDLVEQSQMILGEDVHVDLKMLNEDASKDEQPNFPESEIGRD
ncbi:Pyridoxal phosphate-dependent transferase major region subdomain 1 [Penicillium odoratum]|uniref:Pyridoxal phosphate-dependent transferase major region subdomain 1 n=1 Tax=Penicillium odoratum TaxID=1167516 RepID=UPI002547C934|nr:Pyridoxal phosphate-dependent transferase major region subdomain 1 [Penicillium odoratum]KAJ5769384.1 Pyridoxal phosphate-dependent transferase major region subdomain 1 [Penicillium odoratum]